MSGIAGIYNLDGRPVDPALLKRMTDVISHRGPDGVGHWIDGPVGLGHRMPVCFTSNATGRFRLGRFVRGDEDYAEHFLEIFKEAVRCRLRLVEFALTLPAEGLS